ncbi:MAG: hypothetical protein DMF96_24435 [Acidobacteria bacterium]|nr:MAG: hypothetical protein DMF96_24435 [Acidobacteriota bacterium]
MRRLIVPSALAVLGLGAAFALLRSGTPLHPGATPGLPVLVTEQARVRVVTLTDGLNQPWALAFLPGGDMLITERGGRMRLMYDGRLASGSIGGLPAVDTRTQDGLMDLALHPRFVQNQLLYFTYSKPGERGDTTALASAKFDGATLTDVRDLFVADAWSTAGGNSGSRIAFGLDRCSTQRSPFRSSTDTSMWRTSSSDTARISTPGGTPMSRRASCTIWSSTEPTSRCNS